jgi:DedD protein
MAFFKFRKGGGDETQAAAPQAESADTLRRRARHRLIGAAVLVLLGVVGFPLLFDTQPRPIAVDIPIEIPDRNKAKPLAAPAAPKAQSGASAAATPVAAAPAPAPAPVASAPVASTAVVPVTPPVQVAEAKKEPAPEVKAEARPQPAAKPATETSKPQPAQQAKAEAPARPQSLLESKAVQSLAPVEGRYVVQVGAFSDVGKARQARQKVEKAGLKTYTHVADTKDGKRIRVRVGPFATRAEADKAAGRLKELDLPAAILTL